MEEAGAEGVVVVVAVVRAREERNPWRSPQMNLTRSLKTIMQKPCKPEEPWNMQKQKYNYMLAVRLYVTFSG